MRTRRNTSSKDLTGLRSWTGRGKVFREDRETSSPKIRILSLICKKQHSQHRNLKDSFCLPNTSAYGFHQKDYSVFLRKEDQIICLFILINQVEPASLYTLLLFEMKISLNCYLKDAQPLCNIFYKWSCSCISVTGIVSTELFEDQDIWLFPE